MSDTRESRNVPCFFCEPAWAGISLPLRLSEKDVDILQCVMMGKSDRAIADFLGLRPSTLRTHLERIGRKLGAHRRVELVGRLHDAHIDWLCEASPPPGCRVKQRLERIW